MSRDAKYMLMALQLASKGLGDVEPNPAVGAIIVKNGKIIGSGWHKKFGGPHAEINALKDCRKRGVNPEGSMMYVTLEPCCHFGKTGPCTDALIAAKLKKVIVAAIDPSKHANGKGIKQLRNAGIKVEVGLWQNKARILNAPFMIFAASAKTWVTLKWAQSIDGYLARTDKKRWISNSQSRKDAHNLRRRAGAILVGINTVIEDDPLLTPRPDKGKKPLRIVLDNHLRIPLNCKLMKTAKKFPLLIVTLTASLRTKSGKAKRIIGSGAEIISCPTSGSNLKFLLKLLAKRGIQHLLVEGGPSVITSFLKAGFADEIIIYVSPEKLGTKGKAQISQVTNSLQLLYADIKHIRKDIRITAITEKGFEEIGKTGLKRGRK